MSNKNGFCDSLNVILKEMCKRVGAKYKNIDFNSNDWYKQYNWSKDEEQLFKRWLIDYLYKNEKARKELMTITIKDRNNCKEAATWFLFQYGWTYKNMTVRDVEEQVSEVAKLEKSKVR